VLVPSPCYTITPSIKSSELNYLLPAIKIRFDSAYVPAKAEFTSMYVFDDSKNEYFVLSYQQVPDNIDAKP
jgi:hypothetical protein